MAERQAPVNGVDPSAAEIDRAGLAQRHPFVGRERELQQLQEAFAAAHAGQGSLAMVVGELGIGKTSLCEQLVTRVTILGGRAFVGHCYEAGSPSVPYLPFVEAMRAYVAGREDDALRQEIGPSTVEVARLVPEIGERLQLILPPAGDPESARWRLLQAVTEFLHRAAAVHPLLIVLEDLHDADRSTLDLLVHLARSLVAARILVVGTYRDVEVDRDHPLASALAELRRATPILRVPLGGLTVDQVEQLMGRTRALEPSRSRAEAIHRQAEGNPLFVQEVLRDVGAEDSPVSDDGRDRHADLSSGTGVPPGLREVVRTSLSRLGDETWQVLELAAVIGREFRLDVLERVAGLPEGELYGALEAATRRGVVEPRAAVGAVGFRFTHAFFRQLLYEETFTPRRIRFHQRVGRILEELYQARLAEHAAELAEHFIQSAEPADLEKALRYTELAAQRAVQVFAFGQAVSYLERALGLQEVVAPEDRRKRCDLLLAQAEAMLPLEEPYRVVATVAPDAFALAEAMEDSGRAARAAIMACEADRRSVVAAARDSSPATRTEFEMWAVRAERYAAPGTPDRVYAEVYRGVAEINWGRPALGHPHIRRAVELALELGDTTLLFFAAGWAVVRLRGLRDRQMVDQLVREVLTRSHHGVRAANLGICLFGAGLVLLRNGDREGAEAVWRQLAQHAEHTHDTAISVLAMGCPIYLAYLDGRLEEALALLSAAQARARELGVHLDINGDVLLFYLGRGSAEALKPHESPLRTSRAYRSVLLAHLGRHEEVREIRQEFGDVGSEDDDSGAFLLLDLFEAAILGSNLETVRALLPRLAPLADALHVGCGPELGGSVGRYLGDACVLLGRPTEARAYYQRALEVCGKARFRPEAAITHLHLAELFLDEAVGDQRSAVRRSGGDEERTADRLRPEGLKHLDVAIGEFRALEMRPLLARALALQRSLRRGPSGGAQAVYPDGLSEREIEVLRLIAAGKSNREIAAALVISLNTLFRHVSNILGKTGAANRTEAAHYATHHGLTG